MWLSNGTGLTLPTGEGAPSKNEGVGGVFVWGLGKSSPVGLGNAQGVFFCHVVTRLRRQGPRRALYIFDA
ncbi:hypothetical protein BK716_29395 [Bacillus thuringiensis serovar higo]|uniref:Uncharacterized protein n=1 Tax=Bacillus thuringiensis subsp. higo TaxID=132266 RepID=A0A9X6QKA9_BACUH|nr:hypothetical protein BK716_29395 [Bacillus thuringiensis serovar higo]